MRLPDALRPYTSLIKWGIIAVLAGFLFVSGCNYGENKSEAKIVQLENDKAILQQANASWAKAAEERNRQIEDNVAASERLQREAERDADKLADGRKDTDKIITSNQSKLEAAIRDPKCNELLELKLCPTVPLPKS